MIGRITAMIRFARCRKFLFQCISIGVILAMVASACLFKLASIQLIDGQMAAQAATQARTKKVIVHSMRGKITDTNGTVLAQSVERYTIIADPWAASQFEPIDCDTQKAKQAGFCHKVNGKPVGVKGSAGVARLLAPVLKMDAKTLGAKLTGTSRYMILKKDVTPTVKRAIDDLNLGGVVYGELSSQRIYANGTQLGALLGGVDDSGKGVAGVESMENSALTGTDGYVIYQQGNGGEEIPGTLTGSQEAVNGSDVALTLDHDVDWYVKQALLEGQKKTKATWAMAVVQDIQTGEILALEDTDEYQAGSDQAKLNASRAVSESFEPGSVGKVITMSGLLQTGLHKATDKFTVPYSYTKDGQEYHDSSAHGDEHWTLAGIIKNSSNVGVVMASSQYTKKQRYEYLTKFGIGQSSGMSIPGESRGQLGTPESWDGRTSNTILFGQGYSVNALQQQGRAQAAVADQVGHPRRRHGGDAAGELFHARHRRVGRRPGQERHGIRGRGIQQGGERQGIPHRGEDRYRRGRGKRRPADLDRRRFRRNDPGGQPALRHHRDHEGPAGHLRRHDGWPGVRQDW